MARQPADDAEKTPSSKSTKKQTAASKEMAHAEVHLDGLISDGIYLQQTLEGLLARRSGFNAKREIAKLLSEVNLIVSTLPKVKDDLTDLSLQWAIDTLVEGGVQELSRTLTPALERLIFAPEIKRLADSIGNHAIQVDTDNVYLAVSAVLEGYGFSRTDADELVTRRMADIYDAAARIVPMPDRTWDNAERY